MLKIYTKNHQDDNQDDNQDDTKINGLISTVSEIEPPRNHQDNNQDDNPSIIDNIINNKNNNIVQNVAHECDLTNNKKLLRTYYWINTQLIICC